VSIRDVIAKIFIRMEAEGRHDRYRPSGGAVGADVVLSRARYHPARCLSTTKSFVGGLLSNGFLTRAGPPILSTSNSPGFPKVSFLCTAPRSSPARPGRGKKTQHPRFLVAGRGIALKWKTIRASARTGARAPRPWAERPRELGGQRMKNTGRGAGAIVSVSGRSAHGSTPPEKKTVVTLSDGPVAGRERRSILHRRGSVLSPMVPGMTRERRGLL